MIWIGWERSNMSLQPPFSSYACEDCSCVTSFEWSNIWTGTARAGKFCSSGRTHAGLSSHCNGCTFRVNIAGFWSSHYTVFSVALPIWCLLTAQNIYLWIYHWMFAPLQANVEAYSRPSSRRCKEDDGRATTRFSRSMESPDKIQDTWFCQQTIINSVLQCLWP